MCYGAVSVSILLCSVALRAVSFLCSENAVVHVDARDNSFIVTVTNDAEENRSVHFQLPGIILLPVTCQHLQASSDQAYHLRLGLKEITQDDGAEKSTSADDRITDIESTLSAAFYCHCRKCGNVVFNRLS